MRSLYLSIWRSVMKLSSFMTVAVALAVVIGLMQSAEARCDRGRCNFGVVSINAQCHTVAGTACEAGKCTIACSPCSIVEPEVKPEVKPKVKPEVKPEVKPKVKPEDKPEGKQGRVPSLVG